MPETAEIGPVIPRGIAVGGPQPLLYIADAAGAVMAFQADPPYDYMGTAPDLPCSRVGGGNKGEKVCSHPRLSSCMINSTFAMGHGVAKCRLGALHLQFDPSYSSSV